MFHTSASRAATLLVGLVAMVISLLINAQPTQATVPTHPGTVVIQQTPKDHVYRGYVSCSGGPNSWCWGAVFRQVSGCGSNAYGCFYMSGKYWVLRNTVKGPYDEQGQLQCIAGIASAVVGFYFTGPAVAAVSNGFLTLWGCSTIG